MSPPEKSTAPNYHDGDHQLEVASSPGSQVAAGNEATQGLSLGSESKSSIMSEGGEPRQGETSATPSQAVDQRGLGRDVDNREGLLVGLEESLSHIQEEEKKEGGNRDHIKDDPKGKQPETDLPTSDLIDLTSSVSTIRPLSQEHAGSLLRIPSSQHSSLDPASLYVDPTPSTPTTSQPPSRTPSTTARSHRSDEHSPVRSDAGADEKRYTSDDDQDGGSQSEIQSIMEQFSEFGGGPGAEEVMSPRLEITSPTFGGGSMQHPPRRSSLEPLNASVLSQASGLQSLRISGSSPTMTRSQDNLADDQGPPVPPKDGNFDTPSRSKEDLAINLTTHMSSQSPAATHRPSPPEPEPEPSLPFDFHRFLEQLRNKKADPVARYLKSFLSEFGKRQWMVHEQVKIIGDFLAFIANKMAQCEVWKDVSDAEFDNAREGMEKLVMNRLYSQTFSPAIPPPKPIPGAKPKKKGGDAPLGPGRRGQHQEDVERDNVLTQKINIYGWVKEEHLDISPVGESGRKFLKLAQQGKQQQGRASWRIGSLPPINTFRR